MNKSWIPIPRHTRKYRDFGYEVKIDIRNVLSWEVFAYGPEDHLVQPLMSNTVPTSIEHIDIRIKDSHNAARAWIDGYIEERRKLKRAMSQNKSYRESKEDFC